MQNLPSITLVGGLGNTGSVTASLLARDPRVRLLALVDHDKVDSKNVHTQLYDPEDVGRPKVEAMRDKIYRTRPDLEVLSFPCEVEDVPAGFFTGQVHGCFDSDAPRQVTAARTWRMGGTLSDCAVRAPDLVRVTEIEPGGDHNACFECSWPDERYEALPVRDRCGAAAATNAPVALGALSASLAVLRAQQRAPQRGGDTTELVGTPSRLFESTMPRNPQCRFDHVCLRSVQPLEGVSPDQTLGSLFEHLQCEAIHLAEFQWDRRRRCGHCAHEEEILRVARGPVREKCILCGVTMHAVPLYAEGVIRKSSLSPSLLSLHLREVGVEDGDVVIPEDSPQGFVLGRPFAQPSSIVIPS